MRATTASPRIGLLDRTELGGGDFDVAECAMHGVISSAHCGASGTGGPIADPMLTPICHCPARPGNPVRPVGVYWIARSSRAMTAKCVSTEAKSAIGDLRADAARTAGRDGRGGTGQNGAGEADDRRNHADTGTRDARRLAHRGARRSRPARSRRDAGGRSGRAGGRGHHRQAASRSTASTPASGSLPVCASRPTISRRSSATSCCRTRPASASRCGRRSCG